jgi:predicted negative regulator of RcsB-dependent stress response
MAKIKKKATTVTLQPDEEIRSIAHHAADLYQSYRLQFNTVLTVVVVALLGWGLYAYTQADKERKAGRMLDAAYGFFSPAGSAAPDLPKALQGFREVVNQYGGTLSGAMAEYFLGNTLVQMGRTDEALKAYQQFQQRHSGEKLLSAMVYQRMGYLYLGRGNREEAVKAFLQAETAGGAGMATAELAGIYERAGNAEDAQKKYKELSEKLPATTLALDAKMKLPPPDLKAPFSAPAGTK